MLEHIEVVPVFAISGGIAKNIGVVDVLKKFLKVDIFVPNAPDKVSALGAALIAEKTAKKSD